jgi:hypothetical protein
LTEERRGRAAAVSGARDLLASLPSSEDAWAVLARWAPDDAVAAWEALNEPDPLVTLAFMAGAAESNDRTLWETALAVEQDSDRPSQDLVRVRLEGLAGRPDRSLDVFAALARYPTARHMRPRLIPLALSLAAAGQTAGVAAALRHPDVHEPGAFRPLVHALDPEAVPDASAEELAIADDVRARLDALKLRSDIWRDDVPRELPFPELSEFAAREPPAPTKVKSRRKRASGGKSSRGRR